MVLPLASLGAMLRRHRPHRGQALAETAILLPVLLILLLGAIDFGRAFFGWANLHQAARNGANYASINATMTSTEQARYVALVESDLFPDLAERRNPACTPQDPVPSPSYRRPDGTPTTTPVLGDFATLTLYCDFSPLTPLMDLIVGDPLRMTATATFPIREGCINCPTPVPAPPPPPPIQCFAVPAMENRSVAGARAAWVSAGFRETNFTVEPAGAPDSATVGTATVTEDDPLSNCSMPAYAVYSSRVEVTPLPDGGPCAVGEAIVPNMIGMSLGDARTAWDVEFDALNLQADGGDPAALPQTRTITDQSTAPTSTAGVSCLDVTATADVTTGPPLPPPPPTPCRVPNMTNLTRPEGQQEWVEEGFESTNFSPNGGTWIILSQSLVGGTYVDCGASVRVSQQP